MEQILTLIGSLFKEIPLEHQGNRIYWDWILEISWPSLHVKSSHYGESFIIGPKKFLSLQVLSLRVWLSIFPTIFSQNSQKRRLPELCSSGWHWCFQRSWDEIDPFIIHWESKPKNRWKKSSPKSFEKLKEENLNFTKNIRDVFEEEIMSWIHDITTNLSQKRS